MFSVSSFALVSSATKRTVNELILLDGDLRSDSVASSEVFLNS